MRYLVPLFSLLMMDKSEHGWEPSLLPWQSV